MIGDALASESLIARVRRRSVRGPPAGSFRPRSRSAVARRRRWWRAARYSEALSRGRSWSASAMIESVQAGAGAASAGAGRERSARAQQARVMRASCCRGGLIVASSRLGVGSLVLVLVALCVTSCLCLLLVCLALGLFVLGLGVAGAGEAGRSREDSKPAGAWRRAWQASRFAGSDGGRFWEARPPPTLGVIDVLQLVFVLADQLERVKKKTSLPLAEASAKKEGILLFAGGDQVEAAPFSGA